MSKRINTEESPLTESTPWSANENFPNDFTKAKESYQIAFMKASEAYHFYQSKVAETNSISLDVQKACLKLQENGKLKTGIEKYIAEQEESCAKNEKKSFSNKKEEKDFQKTILQSKNNLKESKIQLTKVYADLISSANCSNKAIKDHEDCKKDGAEALVKYYEMFSLMNKEQAVYRDFKKKLNSGIDEGLNINLLESEKVGNPEGSATKIPPVGAGVDGKDLVMNSELENEACSSSQDVGCSGISSAEKNKNMQKSELVSKGKSPAPLKNSIYHAEFDLKESNKKLVYAGVVSEPRQNYKYANELKKLAGDQDKLMREGFVYRDVEDCLLHTQKMYDCALSACKEADWQLEEAEAQFLAASNKEDKIIERIEKYSAKFYAAEKRVDFLAKSVNAEKSSEKILKSSSDDFAEGENVLLKSLEQAYSQNRKELIEMKDEGIALQKELADFSVTRDQVKNAKVMCHMEKDQMRKSFKSIYENLKMAKSVALMTFASNELHSDDFLENSTEYSVLDDSVTDNADENLSLVEDQSTDEVPGDEFTEHSAKIMGSTDGPIHFE